MMRTKITSTHTDLCANAFAKTKAVATLTPNDKLESGQLVTKQEKHSQQRRKQQQLQMSITIYNLYIIYDIYDRSKPKKTW